MRTTITNQGKVVPSELKKLFILFYHKLAPMGLSASEMRTYGSPKYDLNRAL